MKRGSLYFLFFRFKSLSTSPLFRADLPSALEKMPKSIPILPVNLIIAILITSNRIVTFTTELEGLIPSYGDLIAITHDMAQWGQGGEILKQEGLKLTLSEPVTFKDGQEHYLALRKKDGSLAGPYKVSAGELATEVILETLPEIPILTDTDRERTHFAFGTAGKWSVLARVTRIRPRGNTVEITAVIEYNRVHEGQTYGLVRIFTNHLCSGFCLVGL